MDESDNAEKILAIEGVDVNAGMILSGGKTDAYIETLDIFYEDGCAKTVEIRESLEADDLRLYKIYVHAVKGSAAIIGARGLSEKAKALEDAAAAGDYAFIQANNDRFLLDFESLLNNISKILTYGTGDV